MSNLIVDLAYILTVASIVTIIFKRMKQPLVLGYIVAGFLAGPHMPYTPSVSSMEGIEEWSQIGVIFLMFTLGLEFSFKKIVRMGMQPIFTAIMVMVCMIGVGSMMATLFGWSSMDRVFLGGMLSMSSTTIIYKAFDDMGLRSKRFASGVISVLIIEDILGILLMVMLSALAVSRSFQGVELIKSLLKLGFFLLLWFIVGIYLVPLLLRKARRYINSETLLVVSVGLCFLLAVSASEVGYSPAFGAFMMGSIMAETLEAENIEKGVSSLRDLFGAVFFVSVGMMVEPSVLADYWLPILVLTLSVVLGQMFFGSLCFFFFSGDVRDSVHSGFSMVQIGEFAFIIAALGQELGVTSSFLYPVVVAVSIITTFFTPYSIRLAPHAAVRAEAVASRNASYFVRHAQVLSTNRQSTGRKKSTLAWNSLVKAIVFQTAAYLTVATALSLFCVATLLPLLDHIMGKTYGNAVGTILTLVILSPCIRAVVMRKNHSREVQYLRTTGRLNRMLVAFTLQMKVLVGWIMTFNVVEYFSPLRWGWNVVIAAAALTAITMSRLVKYTSIRMERTFWQNLRLRENNASTGYGRKLRGKDLQIVRIKLPQHSAWGGRTLSQLHFGRTDRIHIVSIIRGGLRINIPGGNSRIYPGDELEVVGGAEAIDVLRSRCQHEVVPQEPGERDGHAMSVVSITLGQSSPLVGLTLQDSDFRRRYNCMVVGVEDENGHLGTVQAKRVFRQGDVVWVVGEEADISMLEMVI